MNSYSTFRGHCRRRRGPGLAVVVDEWPGWSGGPLRVAANVPVAVAGCPGACRRGSTCVLPVGDERVAASRGRCRQAVDSLRTPKVWATVSMWSMRAAALRRGPRGRADSSLVWMCCWPGKRRPSSAYLRAITRASTKWRGMSNELATRNRLAQQSGDLAQWYAYPFAGSHQTWRSRKVRASDRRKALRGRSGLVSIWCHSLLAPSAGVA